jgi:hypothetical protein
MASRLFCNFFAQLLLSTSGMKIKSLIILATLVGALQLSPVLIGQDTDQEAPGHGARWQHRTANLSPDDQQKLTLARQKAMQDPTVQAAEEKMKEAHRAFMASMRAAMLKADPSVQSVLDKMPRGGRAGRGQTEED